MDTAAEWSPDDHRNRRSPPVMILGRHLRDLVEGAGNEVGKLHLHDRAQAHHRGADGGSHKPRFG